MSFLQQDPRILQEQNNTNVLQDDAGGQAALQTEGEAQNAPSQPVQSAPSQDTGSDIKMPKTSSQAPRSGMFTNIKSYIDKNRQASQKMAESVGQAIQKKQELAKKNLQNVQQRFGSNVEAGTLQNRQSAVQEIQERARQAAGMQTQEQAPQAANDERFKEIIDTKYGGPKNLFETAGYGDAASKVERAQALKGFSESPAQYQQLLDQTLSAPGRTYTAGQKQLDELLFGRQDAQQAFKESTKDLTDMGKYLAEQKGQARQLGLGREQEIDRIRGEARGAFQDVAGQRDQEIEQRLGQVVQDWDKLPEYFRDIFRKGAKTGNIDLSAIEAKTLGLQGGEQLFDALKGRDAAEIIKARDYDKARLIGKDEQSQLAELQRLAGLSRDYGVEGSDIDYRSAYQDAEKAGTQTALDAIDAENLQSVLRDALRTGQDYLGRDYTETGTGRGKYRKGTRKKRVDRVADATASLADVLDKSYVDRVMGQKAEDINVQQDLTGLKNIAKYIDDAQKLKEQQQLSQAGKVDASGVGVNSVDVSPTQWNPEDLAIGGIQAGWDPLGGLASSLGIDDFGLTQLGLEYAPKADKFLDNIGMGSIGDLVGGLGNVGNAIFGGGRGAAAAKAYAMAQNNARRKLQETLEQKAKEQQIGKQINVADTEATRARQNALLNILQGIDKTNL